MRVAWRTMACAPEGLASPMTDKHKDVATTAIRMNTPLPRERLLMAAVMYSRLFVGMCVANV
jgi:hypothetical protein